MNALLHITLIFASAPRTVHETSLELPTGVTIAQALEQSGWLSRFPEIKDRNFVLGIWGRKAHGHTPLRDGDRVEIYRDLRVDPKVARRERFVGQGARGAGLFTRRRPGSKSGY
jgi:putative ubiquitin-RnfH superfamily antitoxin RatB of RatAB toxin-antitoxin module